MSVETGSSIADLNPAWPSGTDSPQEGDDHIRIIKSILQSQFPNLNAPTPITDEELNAIVQGVADAVKKAGDEMTGDLEMVAGVGVSFKVLSEDNIFAKVYGDTDKIFVDIIDPADGTTVLHQIQFDADGLWVKGDFRVDGDAVAVTPPEDDNSTLLATTAFVERALSAVPGGIFNIRDEKASGQNGGSFSSGVWQIRDLTTLLENTIPGASWEPGDVIRLPAGTYEIHAKAPCHRVKHNRARLYNVTGSAIALLGSSEYAGDPDDGHSSATSSVIRGIFTLAVESDLRVEHRCSTGFSTSGLGRNTNFGDNEVYTDVLIRQIA